MSPRLSCCPSEDCGYAPGLKNADRARKRTILPIPFIAPSKRFTWDDIALQRRIRPQSFRVYPCVNYRRDCSSSRDLDPTACRGRRDFLELRNRRKLTLKLVQESRADQICRLSHSPRYKNSVWSVGLVPMLYRAISARTHAWLPSSAASSAAWKKATWDWCYSWHRRGRGGRLFNRWEAGSHQCVRRDMNL